MIHIMICADDGGSELDHGLTLRIELKGRSDRAVTWHEDVSDTHILDGNATNATSAILDTEGRVSWKTECIQK